MDEYNKDEKIIPINIEEEMKTAYIDYSMSVIVSRALPDVRDGLKPVHRRILYGMDDLGLRYNQSYKKSARIVGEVLGKYHPHGDTAVYDTMVRMAQPWSLRYLMVDGQGNYGSIDGDNPAAMRYTEARLQRLAEDMLADMKKNTVDFRPNFDDSLKEPTVLPAKLPNLLMNGSSGIAVGMATNMAPHNVTEVIDGTIAYIENNDIDITGLMQYIKAPDFPSGAIIYGMQGIKKAYETGRGRVVMRATANIEDNKEGRTQIIFSDMPYMVAKGPMLEKIAGLINDKRIEGIAELRDETDRDGIRMVFDLKRDAVPNVVLNMLYKYTQLQSSFSINNVALVKGRPHTLNLKELIVYFVEHRHEVIVRRTQYELDEAEKRAHILEGLIIASDNIDEVIKLIRASKTPNEAIESLMKRFELSEIQARHIVDMRLRHLTGLEQDKLHTEYSELQETIKGLKEILASEELRMNIIKDELQEMKDRYGDERRSVITHSAEDIDIEDLIAKEDMVITISNEGYVKRTALDEYRTQNRGGVGAKAVKTKDTDFPEHLFVSSTHDMLLIFTDYGKVYWKKVYELPEGSKNTKGRPIQNIIQIEQGEKVQAVINVDDFKNEDYMNNHYLVMVTKGGIIKKTILEAYSRPRQAGINAITIKEGDSLLDVRLTSGNDDIIIAKRSGKAIRFNESKVRAMGRTAAGVRGVRLENDEDRAIGLVTIPADQEEANLLVVSEKGYGKRTYLDDPETGDAIYRVTGRGGKGVKAMSVTEKTGNLVAIKQVDDTNDLMIINKSGILIRISVADLRIMGRATQGVKLIKLSGKDMIASVAKIDSIEEEELVEGEESSTEEGTEEESTE